MELSCHDCFCFFHGISAGFQPWGKILHHRWADDSIFTHQKVELLIDSVSKTNEDSAYLVQMEGLVLNDAFVRALNTSKLYTT